MKTTDRYAFGNDGRLWTLYNGNQRRPASVEEMEGFCWERHGVVHYPVFKTEKAHPGQSALVRAYG